MAVYRRLLLVFLFATAALGLCTTPAPAYVVYGPTVSGIWGINPQTGQATKYNTFATPFASTIAAMAQRQSDGLIFFIVGTSGNDSVYTWNPATPSTAPVKIGTTGAGVPYSPRLAFDTQTNVLYAMDTNANPAIWTVNQSTGAFTSTGKTVTGLPSGGGDLVIDTDGTWYVAIATTLYKTTLAGGAATTIGAIATSGGASVTGLALGVGNNLIASDSAAPANILTISKTTAAATATPYTINDGTNAVGDLAGIFAIDMSLSITDNGPWSVTQSTQATYTLTLANNGNIASSGALTVTDTLPAGISYQSASGTGWSCSASGQTVTCTSSTSIAAGSSSAITLNVGIGGVTNTSVTDTATETGGGSPAYLAYDASASDTTTVTLTSAGPLYLGPYDAASVAAAAQFTGSYDGQVAVSNNYDFTARAIPFPNGTVLANSSTVAGSPAGNTITAASVTVDVPNALAYTNNNSTNIITLTATAPTSPAGWTARICPDDGTGTAPNCSSTATIAGDCKVAANWVIGSAGATATSSCKATKAVVLAQPFWVSYTTPSSGLVNFSRYDAKIKGDDGTGSLNETHNELYANFIAVTKSANVIATNCAAGAAPSLPVSDASGAKVCPGGTVRYTIDYRNIVAGAGLGTQGGFAGAYILSSGLTVNDDGAIGNNWAANSAGLYVQLSNGVTDFSQCGVNTSGSCGDSTSGTTFTYDASHPAGTGATKLSAIIGGSGFHLYPPNFAGQKSQGTVVFAIKIK